MTAACFEHRPWIGLHPRRLDSFANALVDTAAAAGDVVHAWCVLPNHYHVLVDTTDLAAAFRRIALLHGRTSHAWNTEERRRGRRVFYRAAERRIRSDAHFFATLNYIHHNAVRHGYVERWTEWPWSSARDYLESKGREEAERIWRDFPLGEYGRGWDDPDL